MPRRDVRHLVALYDRGIAYVDHWIGVLLDGLAELALPEPEPAEIDEAALERLRALGYVE
jgi:hypothetical protein